MNVKHAWTETKFYDKFWYMDGRRNQNSFAFWHTFGNMFGSGGVALLSFLFLPVLLAAIITGIFVVTWNVIPHLGALSPIYKIDHNNLGYRPSSRTLACKILDLPKEDQSLFPNDLMEILSSDLLPEARSEINKSLSNTLNDIKERNEQRHLMEQKAIYHEGVVAAIESVREHIQIETQTLKDYS